MWGGAAASERSDFTTRDQFQRSLAMEDALKSAANLIDSNNAQIDLVELYSCFPCIPKMARRILNWPLDRPATVTGGLSFFGGPYNNYMTHAAASMSRAVRSTQQVGLLYGLGGFATKHHTLVLSTTPPSAQIQPSGRRHPRHRLQRHRPAASTIPTPAKPASKPTPSCTTAPARPDRAIIFARADDGSRLLAEVPASHTSALTQLLVSPENLIGTIGSISANAARNLTWQF